MEEIGLRGVVDLGGFDSGMAKYSSAIEKANNATEKASSSFGSAFSSIGSTVANVMGGAVVNAMSAAASAVGSFVPEAIGLASDLNETVSKIGVVFGENSSQIEDWASTAATSMGISSLQALDAAGTYGALFDAMGIGKAKSTEMSEGLVQLAADMGSFNNMDPTIVMDKLRAAVGGETDGLKTLGININAAAIEHKALAMGLAKTKDGIDANAKAQAVYALVMEQSKTAQGDFARTSDGLANSTKINAAAWADITATIGSVFLPIQQRMTQLMGQFLSGVAPALTHWFGILADAVQTFFDVGLQDYPWDKLLPAWLVPAAQTISGVLDGLAALTTDFLAGAVGFDYPWEDIFPPTVADIAYSISNAIQFVSDHFAAFSGALMGVAAILGGAALYTAITAIGAAIAGLSLPVIAIIGAAALLGAAWNDNWFGIRDATMPILESLWSGIQTLADVVGAFVSGTPTDFPWEDIFPDWLADKAYEISNVFEGLKEGIAAFIDGTPTDFPWEDIFPPWLADKAYEVATIFEGVNQVISDFANGLVGYDYPWEDVFPDWLADAAYKVSAAIQDLVAAFVPLSTAIQENLSGALEEIVNFVSGNETSFDNLKALWSGLSQTASMAFTVLATAVGDALPGFIAAVYEYATAAVSWIGDALPNAITALGGYVAGLIDYISGTGSEQVGGSTGGMASALISWIATDLIPNVAPAMLSFGLALVEAVGKIALALGIAGGEIALALIRAVGAHLPDWIASFGAFATGALSWIAGIAGQAAGPMAAFVGGLVTTVASNLATWAAAFADYAAAAVAWLADVAGQAAGPMSTFVGGLVSEVAGNLANWTAAFADYATAGVQWITGATPKAVAAAGSYISSITGAISSGSSSITASFSEWATAAVSWLDKDAIPKIGPAVGRFIGSVTTGILAGVAAIASAALELAKALIDGFTKGDFNSAGASSGNMIIAGLRTVAHLFTELAAGFAKGFIETFNAAGWGGAAESAMASFKQGFASSAESISATTQGITDKIKTTLLSPNWQRYGSDISLFVNNGVASALPQIISTISDITTGIINAFKQPGWLQLGVDILTLIGNGLMQAASSIYSKVTEIASSMISTFNAAGWTDIGQSIIDGIGEGITNAASALKAKLKGILSDLESLAKDIIGFGSPAKEYKPLGRSIIDGIIVGMGQRAGALVDTLENVMRRLGGVGDFSATWMDWADKLYGANRALSDFSSSFSDIVSLGKSWGDLNKGMLGGDAFNASLAGYDRFNQKLQDRIKLLDIIKNNNLNPRIILQGANIATATPEQIASAIKDSAAYLANATKDRLAQEQKELQRIYDLQGAMAQFNGQLSQAETLGKHSMNFFQKIEFDQLTKQFEDLGNQLQQAQAMYVRTGDTDALGKVDKLLSDRQAILAAMQGTQPNNGLGIDNRNAMTAMLNQQSAMLDQAAKLGWNVSQVFSNYFDNADNMSTDALRKMSMLQEVMDQANFDALRKSLIEKGLNVDLNTNVSGVASSLAKQYAGSVLDPLLAKLRSVLLLENERTDALNAYNNALGITKTLQKKQDQLDFLQSQLDLIGKATSAGVNLGSIFNGIALGGGANITDLLTASNRLMDALVKKAQEQLTPEALALADKQTQLANLKTQLDLIKQAKDAGLGNENIFTGLTMGINATANDITIATTRLIDQLIKNTKKELGIASPSKVFADIGKNIVWGLGQGMEQAFSRPLMQPATVAHGPVSNRSINMSMGGVNIYTPMDEVMFENRVQRIIERAIN